MIRDSFEQVVDKAAVDEITEKVSAFVDKNKRVLKPEAIKARFAVDEVLLTLCEKYEEKKKVKVVFESKIGYYTITLFYHAEQFNPLKKSDTEDEWTKQALDMLSQSASYSFKDGLNQVTFTVPKKRIRTEVYLVAAVASALLCGTLGNLISPEIRNFIIKYVLNLTSDVFMNLLGVFSGLMIFLALVNGICGMGSVADFNKIGKTIIARYLGLSFLGGAILTFISLFFFHLERGGVVRGTDLMDQVLEIVMQIIPSNPIAPFYEENMLQIIFLAVFVGVCILAMGSKVDNLKSAIGKCNELTMKAVNGICTALPIFIFTSLLSMFWEVGFSSILSFWKPILVSVVLGLVIPLFKLIYISLRYHISPFKIVRRLMRGTVIGFATASSAASFSAVKNDLINGLGLEESFVDFAYPIGINLYGSTYMLMYLTIILYLAEVYKTPVSPVWIVLAWFLSVVFSIATPNVSGGALICIGVMLQNLSIPTEGLPMASTMIIILDFYLTSNRNFTQELEVFRQGKLFGKVDESVLKG